MSVVPKPLEAPTDRLGGFLRQVVAALRDDQRSDAALLVAFATGDQEAFRALVGRHGRSVWAVCLSQLGDPNDADDAFQAAFMALARRAGAIDVGRDGVGPWVRTAARRAARQLRRTADRLNRLRSRLRDASPGEAPGPDVSETWSLVAIELDRLSARLREPLVMYHLEGRTLAQVADVIGCSIAEAHRRIDRGTAVLRERLSARGVALTASALAPVPFALMSGAVARAGEVARGADVPPRLAALVDAALRPRSSLWLLAVGAAALACGTAALGLASLPPALPLAPPPIPTAAAAPVAQVAADSNPIAALLPARPTAPLSGLVTDADGRPVPGAGVAALVRRPWLPSARGLRDDVIARTTAGPDGRYRLDVPNDFHTHYHDRTVTLLVTAPGHSPATRGAVAPGACDMALSRTRTVSGVLLTPDGAPVEGVRVGVLRLGGASAEPIQGARGALPDGWPAEVRSRRDGSFAVPGLPAGEEVWLEVRDDRFALVAVRAAPAPVRVTLSPARVLRGTVAAADTGRPLTGARVSVFAGPWEQHHDRYTAMTAAARASVTAPPVEFDAETAEDGRFDLRLPAQGPYRVFIHPPAGAGYLAIGRVVEDVGPEATRMTIGLPPGETLHGVLRDDRGRPVAGGWATYEPGTENPSAPRDMLAGRDAPVRSAADGTFRLVVPPGAGTVQVFGPDSNFRPATYNFARCAGCGTDHLRRFEHARVDIRVPHGCTPDPVALTLVRGAAVAGRAVGPDGEPVRSGVLVCRSVVQPLRNLVVRPQPIRDGVYELPGCSPGRVYPVVFLDSERRLGAVAELSPGAPGPLVKLEACGTAEVRLVDPAGRPLRGIGAAALIVLDCDRAGALAPTKPGANPVDQSWFDHEHHLPVPKTDAEGRVTLRSLVPGADYAVRFVVGKKVFTSATFRVKPGQVARLPDVVAGSVKRPATKVVESSSPIED